jgi:dTDP-4-amino-4,6-dideoxygalactose transaminase
VIEDAAQAIGATCNGQPAGSLGDVACFSFYPTKNLGGFGDGGMLTTNDAALALRLRLLAAHGMSPRYYHREIGINSRLDTLQAAILNVKLQHLHEWTTARRANAARYWQLFQEHGLAGLIGLPPTSTGQGHVWNQYTIRIPNGRRDDVKAFLAKHHVGSEIYYPVPLHLQECYASLGYHVGSLPATEQAAAEVLSLPIFPELSESELQTVVVRLHECLGRQRLTNAA